MQSCRTNKSKTKNALTPTCTTKPQCEANNNPCSILEQDDDTEEEEETECSKTMQTQPKPKKNDAHTKNFDADAIRMDVLEELIRSHNTRIDKALDDSNERDRNEKEEHLVNEIESSMHQKVICKQSMKIDEVALQLDQALEDIRLQEELDDGDEEALGLCKKIDVLEYQIDANLERLEEHVMKEEGWRKKAKVYEEKERMLMLECKALKKKLAAEGKRKQVEKEKGKQKKKEKDSADAFHEHWTKIAEEQRREYARCRQRNE